MRALPLAVRIAAAATVVVALGSAVLSWDALRWGAGQLGVDAALTWLFPVVLDGTIVVGTAAALALRRARRRVRAYVWGQLVAAIGASVVGNAAHAAGGTPIHQVGSALPAVALAASLHLLLVLVRESAPAPRPPRGLPLPQSPRQPPRGRHRGSRAPRRVDTVRELLAEGQELSADQVAERFHVARAAAEELLRAARSPQRRVA